MNLNPEATTASMAMERQAKFTTHQQEMSEKQRAANLEAMQKIAELLSNPNEDIKILESKFEILELAYPHIKAQSEKTKKRHVKLLLKGAKISVSVNENSSAESLLKEVKENL